LDNEFCYKGLIESLTDSVTSMQSRFGSSQQPGGHVMSRVNQINLTSSEQRRRDSDRNEERASNTRPRSPARPLLPRQITSKITSNINSFSANRRRARSQSKSHLGRNVIGLNKMVNARDGKSWFNHELN
jgi:hypothetical protein